MRRDRVWEIAKKDMASARKHRYVLYGMVVLPLVLSVVLPIVYIYPVLNMELPLSEELPPFAPAGLPYREAMVMAVVNMTLLLFMVIPVMVPSVIASYTFVGEKVNRQLEPLLATPVTDSEILAGKMLGAFLPAMLATGLSFVCLTVVVDVLTFQALGHLLLPNLLSVAVLCVYCPLMALFSVSFCVLVSSKVSDVRAAMQIGSIPILPFIAFYMMYMIGAISLNPLSLGLFAAVLGLADAGLFLLSKATFRREEILTRWK
ncbi:MAG: ABC transporter permease subunit [Candidatus Hadarchaeales archaeon]